LETRNNQQHNARGHYEDSQPEFELFCSHHSPLLKTFWGPFTWCLPRMLRVNPT
jgi:hypothetical protein